ncbi:hypothetical protein ACET3Z_028077 [Daucus carota]
MAQWLSGKDQRILDDCYDSTELLLTVPADASGAYQDNVDIPSYKTNIVLLGDGSDLTFVTGNKSVGDGWTSFRSATLVPGEGYLARDVTIENIAGPKKKQAVAVRVNADLAAMYRDTIDAVMLQDCNIVSKMPLPGQFTVITAQSRDSVDKETGIAMQNCSIFATEDLYTNSSRVKSYLVRPWNVYSRAVYLESYIDDFITPEGSTKWTDHKGLNTLYYAEYEI